MSNAQSSQGVPPVAGKTAYRAKTQPESRGFCHCLGDIVSSICGCQVLESARRDQIEALEASHRLEAELRAAEAQSQRDREELLGLLSRREVEREQLVAQVVQLSRMTTPVPVCELYPAQHDSSQAFASPFASPAVSFLVGTSPAPAPAADERLRDHRPAVSHDSTVLATACLHGTTSPVLSQGEPYPVEYGKVMQAGSLPHRGLGHVRSPAQSVRDHSPAPSVQQRLVSRSDGKTTTEFSPPAPTASTPEPGPTLSPAPSEKLPSSAKWGFKASATKEPKTEKLAPTEKSAPPPVPRKESTGNVGGSKPGKASEGEKPDYTSRRPITNGPAPLLIVDTDNHRVMRWYAGEEEGELVAGGCGPGDCLNQLQNPTSITLDSDGALLIADPGNDRIMRWEDGDEQGTVVAGGNGRGDACDQLNNPTVLVLGKGGALIIVDMCNHRVVRWPKGAKRGEVIAGGNGPGQELNQLDNPSSACFNTDGSVIIADLGNNRIMRWARGATEGEVVAGLLGTRGPGMHELNGPTGVVLDGYGKMLIADAGNNRVLKWEMGQKEAARVVAGGRDSGRKLYQLKNPTGIALDGGALLVADLLNHRVMRWEHGSREGSMVAGGRGRGEEPFNLSAPTGICLERLGGDIRIELQSQSQSVRTTRAWRVEGPASKLKQLQHQRALATNSYQQLESNGSPETSGQLSVSPKSASASLQKMNEAMAAMMEKKAAAGMDDTASVNLALATPKRGTSPSGNSQRSLLDGGAPERSLSSADWDDCANIGPILVSL